MKKSHRNNLLHSNYGAKVLIAARKSQGPSGCCGIMYPEQQPPALRVRSEIGASTPLSDQFQTFTLD